MKRILFIMVFLITLVAVQGIVHEVTHVSQDGGSNKVTARAIAAVDTTDPSDSSAGADQAVTIGATRTISVGAAQDTSKNSDSHDRYTNTEISYGEDDFDEVQAENSLDEYKPVNHQQGRVLADSDHNSGSDTSSTWLRVSQLHTSGAVPLEDVELLCKSENYEALYAIFNPQEYTLSTSTPWKAQVEQEYGTYFIGDSEETTQGENIVRHLDLTTGSQNSNSGVSGWDPVKKEEIVGQAQAQEVSKDGTIIIKGKDIMLNQKKTFDKLKKQLASCTQDCTSQELEVKEAAQYFVGYSMDVAMIEIKELHIKVVVDSQDIPQEHMHIYNAVQTDLDFLLERAQRLQPALVNAKTKEEIQSVAHELAQIWKEFKLRIDFYKYLKARTGFNLPEVDDEVLVLFEHGDAQAPAGPPAAFVPTPLPNIGSGTADSNSDNTATPPGVPIPFPNVAKVE